MATEIPHNQAGFTLGEIARATGGALAPDAAADARVVGVATDSRTIAPGALFVALVGELHDGHAHAAAAHARGARAALVARGRASALPAGLARIEVDDTLAALGALAAFHLERVRAARGALRVVTVGGAAGKTTTKELLAAAARALYGEVLATRGNLNNRVGVPMTLFTLTEAHAAAVIECGTNAPGEIAALGAIVRPDVALVINTDFEHTEGLGSLEAVADEEAAVFACARAAVVTNADDPRLIARLPTSSGLRALTFGDESGAPSDVTLRARRVGADGVSRVTLALPPALRAPGVPATCELELGLLGHAAALDAAAALAALSALRAAPFTTAELDAVRVALRAVPAAPGRFAPLPAPGGTLVLDDTYNANPRSVHAALAAAREIVDGLPDARLVCALGDMLELGALAPELHREVAARALAARPAVLVGVGPEMTAALTALASAPAAGHVEVLTARDAPAAAELLAARVRPGDVALIKGSRGIKMERIVAALAAAPPRPAAQ